MQARETLINAYEKYYAESGHIHASAFIKNRCEFYLQRGIPSQDIARIEVGAAIGLLSNTKPAAFWLLYHLCSDPEILGCCRQELFKAVHIDAAQGTATVDVTRIKSSCPLLFSTFKEVFRFHGMGIAIRKIVEDETLANQYLLKKDSFLLIPATVQHNMQSVWGRNVEEFDHRRFSQTSNIGKNKRPNPVAFRGFGGGSTLCPGRHFAATEILVFASLAILRFDILPLDGQWVKPTVKNSKPGLALHQPDDDIEIELRPTDISDLRWIVQFSESKESMNISAEDDGSARE